MLLARALDSYLRHVTIERGLSDHTVSAYRRDLDGYIAWLSEHGVTDTSEVTSQVIGRFIEERSSEVPPPAATSLARLQSSVRGWHRYLAREGIEQDDPSGRLRPPKAPGDCRKR